jgi:hypothetical protein
MIGPRKLYPFVVTDLAALAAFNPHLVQLQPNKPAIRKALALGFKLPGVEVHDTESCNKDSDGQ